jgi:FKBP-type peptidyl-prolyl cis-trans isomerase FkpA
MSKMKQLIFLTFIAAVVILSSCATDYSEDRERAQLEFENYILNNAINDSFKLESGSGVYVIPITKGRGNFPKPGENVSIRYSVWYIDSTFIFDNYTNINSTSITLFDQNTLSQYVFPVSMPGLHEGLLHIREGGKATILIPSKQAFDHRKVAGVNRFSSFIVRVEVTNLQENIFE